MGNSLSLRASLLKGDCKPGEGRAELGALLRDLKAPLGRYAFLGMVLLSSLLCFLVTFVGFAARMR